MRMKLERSGVCPAGARQGSWRAGILRCLLAGRTTLDREVDLESGALPGGAVDRDGPPEGLDPVGEPDEAGTPPGRSATDAVVTDRQLEAVVAGLDPDVDDRRVGVLGGVGQRLGDDVVGRHLDRLSQPCRDLHLQLDRDGGAAGQRLERRREAAFGQDGRVDAARQLPQVLQRPVRPSATLASCALSSGSSGGTAAWAARRSSTSDTSRCWVPSWRSRSIRRRAWSAAATTRVREAASSSRLSSNEPAMVLKLASSIPISPTPRSGMRAPRSPPASRPAIAAARRTGCTIARVR
jgi:hypothetical protein